MLPNVALRMNVSDVPFPAVPRWQATQMVGLKTALTAAVQISGTHKATDIHLKPICAQYGALDTVRRSAAGPFLRSLSPLEVQID